VVAHGGAAIPPYFRGHDEQLLLGQEFTGKRLSIVEWVKMRVKQVL
jgi:hypothetical protein